MISIIKQERAEAVREYRGQVAMVHADELGEAYAVGFADGQKATQYRSWWLVGLLCGIALSALTWIFWS